MWTNNTLHAATIMWQAELPLQKIDEICPSAIPNQISIILMHNYQVLWKSIVIYSSYCPETKIWT